MSLSQRMLMEYTTSTGVTYRTFGSGVFKTKKGSAVTLSNGITITNKKNKKASRSLIWLVTK
jgi:hypothetical protein